MPALTYLTHFPQWWYVNMSSWWWKFASRSLLLVNDRLTIASQLKALFSPYHNDRTPVGRALGFTFRLCWIVAGLAVLLVLTAALAAGYLVWLLAPLGLLIGLWRGGWDIIGGVLISLVAVAYYWLAYVLQPKYSLAEYAQVAADGPLSTEDLRDFTAGSARRILKDLPGSFSTATLMKSLATTRRMTQLFKRMELSDQQLLARLTQASMKQSQVITQQALVEAAIAEAQQNHHRHLTSTDLFLGLIRVSPAVADSLKELGIHLADLQRASSWVEAEDLAKDRWRWWTDEHFHRLGGVDRGWTSGWTPTMKHLSVDVTAQVAAGQVPYIIGRTKEIEEVVRVLERTTKNNVLLIGEPGVGKSSIVDGIAQSILQANASPVLADSRVIQLDLEAVLSSAPDPRQMEQTFTAALKELVTGKTILFIDAIEHLVTQTGAGTIDVTALLLPFIESGQLKVIGATTRTAFHNSLELNTSFTSHFQTIAVEEPDVQTAVGILQEFAAGIETKQGVTISLPAIQAAVELSQQYIHDRVLPEKAIDLLDETAAFAAHQRRTSVSAEDVATVVADKTGVPVTQVTQDEATKLNNLEELMHQRLIGQDTAVMAVANALRRSRAGLRDNHRPMAVFLFVGPTGTGKTELAKTIAASYFGDEEAMVRLDMSEYQEPADINKLIGSAHNPAAVSGQLTTAIRERPFTVLLLDELEKAHPQILDLFLQVFDDGRLTDATGRTVQFNQTIIIATSNAGARSIQDAISQGYTTDQMLPAVKEMLAQRYFRPEFLNRFDDIVLFRQLTVEETMQVAKLMLASVIKEVAKQDITLTVTDDLVKRLAEAGYDPLYGARPLRHLIQDKIENALAKQLLAGSVKKGAAIELNSQNVEV
jgi:ATP-dependent Clp protease ATP-binding subunit ClpC